jgi:hypothetical protein
MNQKGLRTIYPPVAEWIFSAAGGVWYHPLALKAMFVAFDLGSIVLLLAMLSSRSQPLRFAGFYAFNPVPLMGFAAEAHFDSLLIFRRIMGYGQNPGSLLRSNLVKFAPAVSNATHRSRRP